MRADQIVDVQPEVTGNLEQNSRPREFDKGFTRNLKLLGLVLAVAVAGVGWSVYRTSASPADSANAREASMAIPGALITAGKPSVPTAADIDRISRVATRASDLASKQGGTFIPSDLPLVSEAVAPPLATPGPGPGYRYNVGDAGPQLDPAYSARVEKGLERQLERMVGSLAAPGTASAPAYKVDQAAAPNTPAVQPSSPAAPASAVAANAAKPLIPGLHIAVAELMSVVDTAKTGYASARVASGPASGALLFGSAVVVNEAGLSVTFNRMSLNGKAYSISAIALDQQTSSNAMSAAIDRQLFTRYVLPIFGATAKAYFDALARPGSSIVTTPVDGVAQVVSPEATARQAAAAGAGAGLSKAAESLQPKGGVTAYMPERAAIGILFLEPVAP
ncbi:MAG: hypothetical protein V4731_04000 [Pseudomonadota bacterium]